ncbi:hypothetical protein [Mesoflavibacter sp. SCSIO 43206]|uniref:hypothetical protein n=1 Tax=Mesoflavibacter sp. SCSIO 43206 TaxID=2779362 RepID=UPI001CA7C039|nr:hypothetical protein [Mesoflavibacter sp. SCSIO 43206]UAB75808.1 hypothetical protein INR78_02130 [Mesoflavibacter sp. SCSIO 43206]
MKVNTLTIGLFLFSVVSYACSCSYGTLSTKLNSFDNIFTAKVVKVLEYHSNSKQAKKIEVEFLEKINFKYNSNIIYFSEPSGICPIPNPKKDLEWLFYINISEENKLIISECNPSVNLKNRRAKDDLSKLKILNNLRNENLEPLSFYESNLSFFQSDFSRSKYYEFDNDYGLYEVVFDKNLSSVNKITVKKGLGDKFDEKIMSYFKNRFNLKLRSNVKSLVDDNFKLRVLVWKTK